MSEELRLQISPKGEVILDVKAADEECKGTTNKILAALKASGVDIDLLNVTDHTPDDPSKGIKIKC